MLTPPCKDCEKRVVGCRSECQAWQEFEAAKAAAYAERAKQLRPGREADRLLFSSGSQAVYWERKRGAWKRKRNRR